MSNVTIEIKCNQKKKNSFEIGRVIQNIRIWSGLTTACFRIDGTMPWVRILFIIFKTKGSTIYCTTTLECKQIL